MRRKYILKSVIFDFNKKRYKKKTKVRKKNKKNFGMCLDLIFAILPIREKFFGEETCKF